MLVIPVAAQGAKAPSTYDPDFQTFALADGDRAGTVLSDGSLALVSGQTSGTWTGPWRTTRSPFAQAVASWIADTPAGTWVQVELRARAADGHFTKWYVLGQWAYDDASFHRTSVGLQGDADGTVAIDTFVAAKDPMTAYQLRLTLNRPTAGTPTPTVARISAIASDPSKHLKTTSAKTLTERVELDVPEYSQEIHKGDYPEFDNGGEAWCSPTSTSMVVAYWKRGPTTDEYAYVLDDHPGHEDAWVDYAARFTYDYHYQGAGNWPFNVAYAGHFELTGAVTQLRSLAEAEQFVKAGIPLVASIAFNSGKLDGFPFKSTNGHLVVISGFEANGDPIVNDPAAPTDDQVRRTYDRAQFETAWQDATGGIVYLIYPPGHTLPTSLGNW